MYIHSMDLYISTKNRIILFTIFLSIVKWDLCHCSNFFSNSYYISTFKGEDPLLSTVIHVDLPFDKILEAFRYERSARRKKSLYWKNKKPLKQSGNKMKVSTIFPSMDGRVLFLEPRMFRPIRSRVKCQERWALSSITRPVITGAGVFYRPAELRGSAR